MILSKPGHRRRCAPRRRCRRPGRTGSRPCPGSAGLGQAAVRLHEVQPHARQFAGHLLHIAAQDRREVGIDHRGIAARHDARQRRAWWLRVTCGKPISRAIAPRRISCSGCAQACISAMATARMPSAYAACKRGAGGGFVQRLELLASDGDAAADLGDPLMQQVGQPDIQVEQPRPGLVADPQHVGEAAIDQQQHPLALALQQGIGGDGGAHLHRLDGPGRDRRAGRHAEDLADAGDGGVAVARRDSRSAAWRSTAARRGHAPRYR